ncbi:unnamed protein product, partial [Ectocarpus fasciculatus]
MNGTCAALFLVFDSRAAWVREDNLATCAEPKRRSAPALLRATRPESQISPPLRKRAINLNASVVRQHQLRSSSNQLAAGWAAGS